MLRLQPEDYYFLSDEPLTVPELLIGFGVIMAVIFAIDKFTRRKK